MGEVLNFCTGLRENPKRDYLRIETVSADDVAESKRSYDRSEDRFFAKIVALAATVYEHERGVRCDTIEQRRERIRTNANALLDRLSLHFDERFDRILKDMCG